MKHRLFQLLHLAHHRVRTQANRAAKRVTGFTMLEVTAMFVIKAMPGTSVTGLAKALSIDHGAASRLTNQLARKDAIDSAPDPADKRRRVFRLTDTGRAAAAAGVGILADANARIGAAFSEAELDVVARFLTHLIESSETS